MLKNKKAQIGWTIVILILLVVGFLIFFNVYQSSDITAKATASNQENKESTIVTSENSKSYTIEITSSGFSPNQLIINKGDSVTWVNRDNAKHWPASAKHPTHTIYPGVNYGESGSYTGSEACKSEGVPKEGAFDPCRGISLGESWTFTFNQFGNWSYHDHLVNGLYGKIIVK